MTALKQRFQSKFGKCAVKPTNYSLTGIRNQSPKVYSADAVMQGYPGKRCDSFVLCLCAPSTTGIYVVEEKGNRPHVGTISQQLQGGADFVCTILTRSDQFEFLPVLVTKGISASMRKELMRVSIKLREKSRQIAHVKPGDSLKPIAVQHRGSK